VDTDLCIWIIFVARFIYFLLFLRRLGMGMHNISALKEALQSVSFDGVSGRVDLDEDLDNLPGDWYIQTWVSESDEWQRIAVLAHDGSINYSLPGNDISSSRSRNWPAQRCLFWSLEVSLFLFLIVSWVFSDGLARRIIIYCEYWSWPGLEPKPWHLAIPIWILIASLVVVPLVIIYVLFGDAPTLFLRNPGGMDETVLPDIDFFGFLSFRSHFVQITFGLLSVFLILVQVFAHFLQPRGWWICEWIRVNKEYWDKKDFIHKVKPGKEHSLGWVFFNQSTFGVAASRVKFAMPECLMDTYEIKGLLYYRLLSSDGGWKEIALDVSKKEDEGVNKDEKRSYMLKLFCTTRLNGFNSTATPQAWNKEARERRELLIQALLESTTASSDSPDTIRMDLLLPTGSGSMGFVNGLSGKFSSSGVVVSLIRRGIAKLQEGFGLDYLSDHSMYFIESLQPAQSGALTTLEESVNTHLEPGEGVQISWALSQLLERLSRHDAKPILCTLHSDVIVKGKDGRYWIIDWSSIRNVGTLRKWSEVHAPESKWKEIPPNETLSKALQSRKVFTQVDLDAFELPDSTCFIRTQDGVCFTLANSAGEQGDSLSRSGKVHPEDAQKRWSLIGRAAVMAPELILTPDDMSCPSVVDVYSLGVLMYRLMHPSGHYPSFNLRVASGLNWQESGTTKGQYKASCNLRGARSRWDKSGIPKGRELLNSELQKALESKTEPKFTQQEWDKFGICDLFTFDFVNAGGKNYSPTELRCADNSADKDAREISANKDALERGSCAVLICLARASDASNDPCTCGCKARGSARFDCSVLSSCMYLVDNVG